MADPIRVLLSQTSWDADSVTTTWNFSFAGGYLDKAHVKASKLDKATGLVTQIPVTLGMFVGDFTLEIVPAVETGFELTIYRDTPKNLPLVDFADRANLTEVSLDENAKQAIFVAAESSDQLNVALDSVSQIINFVSNAQGFANAASASATAAASSATAAAGSATAAATSATNSANSATASAASAASASTQATNAANSATAAAASATASAGSATAAANSATAADASADAALVSEGNAAGSATAAASSATAAAGSASAAATSATNAAASATASANSATAAASSATAAAASYDSFDDRYLGVKASDPTLDNDGAALLQGALYYNSTTSQLKVYEGAVWQTIGSVPADGSITTAKLASPIAPIVSSLNGGQLAGMRNKIINGKMEIAQRGTSFPALAHGAYSVDRWQWGNLSSGVATLSRETDVPAGSEFQYSLRATVTTDDAVVGAADEAMIQQAIEGYGIRDLVGRTFSIGFWVRSSKVGIHSLTIFNAAADRRYIVEYTVNGANTWEFKSVPIVGGLITAGTWDYTSGAGLTVRWTLIAGTNLHGTVGSWVTAGIASANQVNVLDTVGNIFAITGVQLEVGAQATPFEHRLYGAELALCQRYYEQLRVVVSTSAPLLSAFWKATKRATPTLTLLSVDAGTGVGLTVLGNGGALDGFYQSAANSVTATAAVAGTSEL